MGFWPFRRKGSRPPSRTGASSPRLSDMHTDAAGTARDPASGQVLGAERKRRPSRGTRKASRDSKQSEKEKKRAYSFATGQQDNILVERDRNRPPPVPPLPAKMEGKGRSSTVKAKENSGGRKLLRSSTQPEETQAWDRVPTLHKRSAQHLPRRKSSKKRKEEHDREEEIKAMVAFMPTRAATDDDTAGRPMKRETLRIRRGDPSSDVSLPLATSIHSSLSVDERRNSYQLSSMLAPRPTIRYQEAGPGERRNSERPDTVRRKLSDRFPVPEEDGMNPKKRVDDLADDLDAGELRELMERDQKRKEKKKIADKIRLEQKLARRQERQRQEEAAAEENGTPPPANMDRGVFGREVVGLGIGTSATITSSKHAGDDFDSSAENPFSDPEDSTQNPFLDSHPSPAIPDEAMTPGSDIENPVFGTAQVGTVEKAPPQSPITRNHKRGASSISQMMDLTEAEAGATPVDAVPEAGPGPEVITVRKPEPILQPETDQQPSERRPSGWASIFKRNKTKKSAPPPSFSNTSRDSVQSARDTPASYKSLRYSSNVPKRTMSKFREDLPELPISPPTSRVQSPETDMLPPLRTQMLEKRSGQSGSEDSRVRYGTPTSGRGSQAGRRSDDVPSPEPVAIMSQSLASIGSEGSWLSGRKGSISRRTPDLSSTQFDDSATSTVRRPRDFHETAEEYGVAEDEYFNRLSPEPEEFHTADNSPVPSSDDEDGSIASPLIAPSEETKWGAVARTPTYIHREPRVKSREGLLNDFEYASTTNTPGEMEETTNRKSYGFSSAVLEEQEGSTVRRATSVDLGKGHVRHISAGSARLLELKPKTTAEKRMSNTSSLGGA